MNRVRPFLLAILVAFTLGIHSTDTCGALIAASPNHSSCGEPTGSQRRGSGCPPLCASCHLAACATNARCPGVSGIGVLSDSASPLNSVSLLPASFSVSPIVRTLRCVRPRAAPYHLAARLFLLPFEIFSSDPFLNLLLVEQGRSADLHPCSDSRLAGVWFGRKGRLTSVAKLTPPTETGVEVDRWNAAIIASACLAN